MYQPGRPPIGRARLIVVLLVLGSVLSFGLGQALGHWYGASSAPPITRTAQTHHSATAGGALGSASASRSSPHAQPIAAPPPRTQSGQGEDGHDQHAKKNGDGAKGDSSPKNAGDGASTGSDGGGD